MIIKCKHCGFAYSDKCTTCPKCGRDKFSLSIEYLYDDTSVLEMKRKQATTPQELLMIDTQIKARLSEDLYEHETLFIEVKDNTLLQITRHTHFFSVMCLTNIADIQITHEYYYQITAPSNESLEYCFDTDGDNHNEIELLSNFIADVLYSIVQDQYNQIKFKKMDFLQQFWVAEYNKPFEIETESLKIETESLENTTDNITTEDIENDGQEKVIWVIFGIILTVVGIAITIALENR